MEETKVFPKMFTWLGIGLLISFLTGYVLSTNMNIFISILSLGLWPIIILEFGLAIVMGVAINKMSPTVAGICYIAYCLITGVTFSTIFILFDISSVISIFAICSMIFALLALYGYFTKTDLSRFGTVLFIGLIGLVLGELINAFIFKSMQTEVIFSAIGVAIFVGYIAYDVNKVKRMLPYLGEDKAAIYGAFQLYLDFINLFIRLLELFGKRK